MKKYIETEQDRYENISCVTCGKIYLTQEDANKCDADDMEVCLLDALESGDIDPIYLETALELKAKKAREKDEKSSV